MDQVPISRPCGSRSYVDTYEFTANAYVFGYVEGGARLEDSRMDAAARREISVELGGQEDGKKIDSIRCSLSIPRKCRV